MEQRHAIVMACDAGYAPYAMVLARTIRAQHPGAGFDICLFSEAALELPDALRALDVRTGVLAAPNPFQGGPHQSRHGAAAYLRLMIPGLVAGRYDRVLYLDSDILCTGPGLDRLMAADMGGAWLAAVRDNLQWRTPGRPMPEFRALGRPSRPYLNSGVLLIDVAGWQAAGVEARARALFAEHGAALTRHDQSILNLIADGDWAEMSPVWNWQYTWVSRFFADLADPRLVHFIGSRKPWKDRAGHLPARYRAPYAAMAAEWPGLAVAPAGVAGWPADLRRSLVKHWLAVPRMQAYLARFDDPFRLLRP